MGVVFFHKNQNLNHQTQWPPLQSATLIHTHQHQTWMTSSTTTTRSIITKPYNQISTITQTYFEPLNNPKPPTPSQIKERGTKWVSPRKEEIEGEIKETTSMVVGGDEWRERKPQPLIPIWVSQHTQGGEAVLPIVFSDPCCPPSTKASMIKTPRRDK